MNNGCVRQEVLKLTHTFWSTSTVDRSPELWEASIACAFEKFILGGFNMELWKCKLLFMTWNLLFMSWNCLAFSSEVDSTADGLNKKGKGNLAWGGSNRNMSFCCSYVCKTCTRYRVCQMCERQRHGSIRKRPAEIWIKNPVQVGLVWNDGSRRDLLGIIKNKNKKNTEEERLRTQHWTQQHVREMRSQ